jgi:uncharacterized protein YcgI (DUF1989 family)
MNIAVQADRIALITQPTVCRPGDYVTLRADMDCVVAFSACPQDIVPIQGQDDNTPRDVHYAILDRGFPALPIRQSWTPAKGPRG